ncbi:hypothetical protein GYB22_11735 [bacterium]|nr:hypothetical protein [bacterium]
MKLYLIAFAFLIVFASGACNKPPVPRPDSEQKDSTPIDQPSVYLGSWEYTSIKLTNGSVLLSSNEVGTFTGTGSDIIGEVEITDDPQRYSTEVEFTADLNLVIFQQSTQQSVPVPQNTSVGDWEEKNSKLVLMPDDESDIEIISSTEDKIVFKGNFNQKLTFGQFTFDANSDVEFTIEKL